MSPSKRMQPVAQHARKSADEAARHVAECQRRLEDKQAKIDELLSYRDDYAHGLREKGRSGINAAQVNDYNLFMMRLNKAIDQQLVVLENTRKDLESSKQNWLDKQQRARALDTVVSRYERHERHQQSRREQQENDEHARRRLRR